VSRRDLDRLADIADAIAAIESHLADAVERLRRDHAAADDQ
jgi:hypothetical protein